MAKKAAAATKSVPGDISDFDSFMDDIVESAQGAIRDPNAELEWFSSGMIAANLALSGHPACGFPFGKIINFEGLSDTGKSLMMQTSIREAQQKYGSLFRCLYIDTERGLVIQRLEQMGLCTKKKEEDPKNPLAGTFRPVVTTDLTYLADEVLPKFLAQVHAHPEMRFILAFDSMSMLMTQHERDSEFNKQDMARAKELRKFMRLLNDAVRSNITIFMVHHQTQRISTTGMLASKQGNHDRDIGGGTSMKYVPDVRIEIDYGGKKFKGSEDDKEIVGQKCKIQVVKTRMFKPMIKAELTIDHSCGFTQLGGLTDQLEQLNLMTEVSKGWWTCAPIFGEDKKMRLNDLTTELEKPENVRRVVDLIVEHMKMETFSGEETAAAIDHSDE